MSNNENVVIHYWIDTNNGPPLAMTNDKMIYTMSDDQAEKYRKYTEDNPMPEGTGFIIFETRAEASKYINEQAVIISKAQSGRVEDGAVLKEFTDPEVYETFVLLGGFFKLTNVPTKELLDMAGVTSDPLQAPSTTTIN